MCNIYAYMRISTEEERGKQKYTRQENALKKYAKEYKLDRDLLLTKELDLIYGRLTEEK